MNMPIAHEQLEQIIEQLVQHALWEVQSGMIAATPFTRLVQEATRFQPGDHLITPRTGYWHHGLYVGNNEVIHYSGGADGANIGLAHENMNDFAVEKVKLDQFSQGEPIRLIEHVNPKYTREQACRRAASRLSESKYSIVYRNCEHFVNWCLEGSERSEQIRRLFTSSSGGTVAIRNTTTRQAVKKIAQVISRQLMQKGVLTKLGAGSTAGGTLGIGLSLTSTTSGALLQLGGAGMLAISAWNIVSEQMHRTAAAQKRAEQMEYIRTTLEPILDEARRRFEQVAEQLLRERQEQINDAFRKIADDCTHVDQRVAGMNQLLTAHGADTLEHGTFKEFDRAMRENDDPPIRL